MKKKKRSNRRKWIVAGLILSVIICSSIGVITYRMIKALSSFDELGGFLDNTCADDPQSVESYARFRLPPSYDNLWSICGGMQGWWAEAHFDMSPDDLDSLIDSLWLEVELKEFSTGLNDEMKRHFVLSEDVSNSIQNGLYAYSESGIDLAQEILIDATNPELYRVYLVVLGG